jgi:hypothetical protein
MKPQAIHITIEGITPLICNAFTDTAMLKATNGTSSTTVGDKGTPKEQAQSKLYLGAKDHKPVVPQPNIYRCIIDAGKFFKVGKSKVTTQKSSIIPSCVEMNEVEYLIEHKDDWEVDTRAVRIPSTGGRILCHRPKFNDWKLSFEVILDTEIMSVKFFRDVIDKAGRAIGLGDFRPDCKGPFGRFVVVKWEVEE